MLPLFLIVFLDLLGLTLIIPLLAPLFLLTNLIFPASVPESARNILLGFLIAVYPLAQFFGAPILGALSDHHGRKNLLRVSLIGTFFSYIIFAIGIHLGSLWILFASRAVQGFLGGNISITMSAIADISSPTEKAKNFGLIGMAFGLGFIIGPFIGGVLSDPKVVPWFGFSTPFWVAAGLSVVNMAMLAWFFTETIKKRIHTRISVLTGFRNLRRAFSFEHLRTMFIVVFLINFGFSFFTQFFQVSLIERFAYTQADIGKVFAYLGLWIAITQGIIMRPLSKRVQPPKVLRWSLVLLAVALPVLLVPVNAAWLYAILPFIAIFNGLSYPNSNAIVSNLSAKDSQGEILGINQSIQALAQALPPMIAGFIVALHPSYPTLIGSACIFGAWLIFIKFYSSRKEELFKEI